MSNEHQINEGGGLPDACSAANLFFALVGGGDDVSGKVGNRIMSQQFKSNV